MSLNGFEKRQQEIKAIQETYPLLYPIMLISILIGIGVWLGWLMFGNDGVIDDGYITNLYTEIISIVVTAGVIDFLNRRREEKREEMGRLKTRLRKLMRSPSNEITSSAINELRQHGWHEDGWLSGAYFSYANLQQVDLSRADLQGARLTSANARSANFEYADLQGASLAKAQLQGANLRHADLQGAKLQTAEFDETTVLPDGDVWSPETDIAVFTDPDHLHFWRSSDSESPAYRE